MGSLPGGGRGGTLHSPQDLISLLLGLLAPISLEPSGGIGNPVSSPGNPISHQFLGAEAAGTSLPNLHKGSDEAKVNPTLEPWETTTPRRPRDWLSRWGGGVGDGRAAQLAGNCSPRVSQEGKKSHPGGGRAVILLWGWGSEQVNACGQGQSQAQVLRLGALPMSPGALPGV